MIEKNKILMDMLDFIIQEFNPCKLDGDKCLIGNNTCCFHTPFKANDVCPHLNKGQCSNPNYSCKAWYCETAINNMKSNCKNLVFAVERILIDNDLISHPYLNEPYYGADRSIYSEK
jgi:hypothetical protein